ncbi:hypothetical protein PG999_007415 [Apiospora kogelbergensis]|uniref:Trichothecene 3-O-acetyltransferase-like N-terminal domain-containing protein n=1 Tax=Apiospora kogelbergensis TaxID=1337665 RepID=A0AAW0QY66_9PEZI
MSTREKYESLSPFDHCVPRAYYNLALYIPLKTRATPEEAFELLHDGLRRVFDRLPWLNGKVQYQSPETPGWRPGQLELRYTPVQGRLAQLKFNSLKTDLDYVSLQDLGFPVDCFDDSEIAPHGFFADLNAPRDVFVGQANFLPGGCILVSAIHHNASDEGAYFDILRLWADECAALHTKGAPTIQTPADHQNRGVLKQIWSQENTVSSIEVIDLETWGLVGLEAADFRQEASVLPGPAPQPPKPADRPLKAGVFYISPDNLTALRDHVNGEMGASGAASVNDALCALIWRCLIQARSMASPRKPSETPEEGRNVGRVEESRLNMVYDGRSHYSSALPDIYLGNLTFNVLSSLPLERLAGADSTVGSVAALLRHNAGRADSAKLLNLFCLLDNLSDYDELIRLKRKRTSSVEGNNLSISSMVNVQMDSVCFGKGPVFGNNGHVEAARLLMGTINSWTRTCLISPRTKNGAVEFVAKMYDEEFELLMADTQFAQYVSCLSWPE